MISVKVESEIKPTEDLDIIKKIFQFFDYNAEPIISEANDKGIQKISMELNGIDALSFLYNQVRKQRIVEAVRQYCLEVVDDISNKIYLMLNKQALTQGFVSLCFSPEESPLGPVDVSISAKDIIYLLEYLFPSTEKAQVMEADYKPTE